MISYKAARKIAVAVVGTSVLALGAALLVLPGPGVLVLFAGLAILATEFVWAELLLRKLKRRAQNAIRQIKGDSAPTSAHDSGGEPGGGVPDETGSATQRRERASGGGP
jgi:hypothetical protein